MSSAVDEAREALLVTLGGGRDAPVVDAIDVLITAVRAETRRDLTELRLYSDEQATEWLMLERAIWPYGPAHGSGSGYYAGFKARLVATLRAALEREP